MNMEQWVDRLCLRAGITEDQARQSIQAFIDEMSSGLLRGERITLLDFGTFTVARREAYVGRNPRTGKPVAVPARLSPVFRAGRGLKKAISEHPLPVSTEKTGPVST